MRKLLPLFFCFFLSPVTSFGQSGFDEDQLGAWYMYFWNLKVNDGPWGFQGDIQYRNWNILGDKEQLLIRGGLTFSPPETNLKLTLGYGYVNTGLFGPETINIVESRIYQELLMPLKAGRFHFTHRFRFEQRFVENQDFRTRYRYNIFMNIPLNQTDLSKGALYFAFYNEIFINGQKDAGPGLSVEYFDRNRLYLALGYALKDNLRMQLGIMRQITNLWEKNQLQVSLHHSIN